MSKCIKGKGQIKYVVNEENRTVVAILEMVDVKLSTIWPRLQTNILRASCLYFLVILATIL